MVAHMACCLAHHITVEGKKEEKKENGEEINKLLSPLHFSFSVQFKTFSGFVYTK